MRFLFFLPLICLAQSPPPVCLARSTDTITSGGTAADPAIPPAGLITSREYQCMIPNTGWKPGQLFVMIPDQISADAPKIQLRGRPALPLKIWTGTLDLSMWGDLRPGIASLVVFMGDHFQLLRPCLGNPCTQCDCKK